MADRYFAETEEQLDQLGAEGLLGEDHHIDLKRELGSGPKANKELARDLASFAIDGGALYIGVAEGEAGDPPSLHPIELHGLPERIDQVARSIPRMTQERKRPEKASSQSRRATPSRGVVSTHRAICSSTERPAPHYQPVR